MRNRDGKKRKILPLQRQKSKICFWQAYQWPLLKISRSRHKTVHCSKMAFVWKKTTRSRIKGGSSASHPSTLPTFFYYLKEKKNISSSAIIKQFTPLFAIFIPRLISSDASDMKFNQISDFLTIINKQLFDNEDLNLNR